MEYAIRPIGRVRSSLDDRRDAPRQPDEGAPDAWLDFDDDVRDALQGIEAGTDVLLLTWLHAADRTVLRTRPRDDPRRPETGVFATRSPDRPNPVGLHRVRVVEIDGTRVRVAHLEAIDGTPIVDVKSVLDGAR
jgi:tRNA-Thr(GGU) m(6)t(6)A37 methyltransferase TsaA